MHPRLYKVKAAKWPVQDPRGRSAASQLGMGAGVDVVWALDGGS